MNRAELLETLRTRGLSYDPEVKLLRMPLTATYHTALKPDRHPEVYHLLGSSNYAFDLLETGEQADLERASLILHTVVLQQDRDPARDTYGIWPYFYEEPLDEMDRPDWNMADFHGKRLILVLRKHGDRLSAGLVRQIREAIAHACRAIIKRNMGPHYTNIAIMGAFVTLVGGELLGEGLFRDYGLSRLKRFYDFTFGIGTFSEYNSPDYTPIAIRELHSIHEETSLPEAKALASQLLDLAWRMAGEHYHAGTGEWSGPHSRTYRTMLSPNQHGFLAEAMLDETFEFGENVRCPAEYRGLFTSNKPRSFAEPTLAEEQAGYQVYATLYQDERLSLGSFDKGVMWNQRRNLIAYVQTPGGAVYMQLQFLMNGRDFCSAMYAGAQYRTEALFGFNLLTDNGAWHSDLDKIDGRFRADDLRIRLRIGGAVGELPDPVCLDGKRAELQLGGVRLAVQPVLEEADYAELCLEASRDAEGVYLDYVVYSGEEISFDFHTVSRAVWLFALAINEDGRLPEVAVAGNSGRVQAAAVYGAETISVSLSAAPGPTLERFRSNSVQLPSSAGARV
ncbi:MAG: hypothetical protein K0R57_5077 [Paenibacillaceae bacterium]|jgi:hypothetical protein|nr:hypothetical protein [Paenibacillaceae bacterium]